MTQHARLLVPSADHSRETNTGQKGLARVRQAKTGVLIWSNKSTIGSIKKKTAEIQTTVTRGTWKRCMYMEAGREGAEEPAIWMPVTPI